MTWQEVEVLETNPDRTPGPGKTGGRSGSLGSSPWGGHFRTPSGYECLGCWQQRYPRAADAATCWILACRLPVKKTSRELRVCEFEDYYGMGQSKVSCHMGKLKEAGLVREERHGKWSFYSLDKEAAGKLLDEVGEHLSVGRLGYTGEGRDR